MPSKLRPVHADAVSRGGASSQVPLGNSIHRRSALTAMGLALLAATPVAAQQPIDPGEPPTGFKLSVAQRQLIYASISAQTHKSTAAPPTFGPTVGANVPDAIELAPFPEAIAEAVPQTRGYAYAFIASQVLIVEPQARRIVEIIAPSI